MTAPAAVQEMATRPDGDAQPVSPLKQRKPLRVLFATDDSVDAAGALGAIQALPLPSGSAIHVVSVIPGAEFPFPDWGLAIQRQQAEHSAEEAANAFCHEGVSVTTETPRGEIAAEIIGAAQAFDADLVVVGSSGRTGIEGFLLGSVARNVAHHSDRPVMVARGPRGKMRRIVVAVDGSEYSRAAIRFATRLPLPAGVEMVVCSVFQPVGLLPLDPSDLSPEYAEMVIMAEQAARQRAQTTVDEACHVLREAGCRSHGLICQGDPGHQLIEIAKRVEADLVVAGARGASLLKGFGIGSVADRLLKSLPTSVLLVREPA